MRTSCAEGEEGIYNVFSESRIDIVNGGRRRERHGNGDLFHFHVARHPACGYSVAVMRRDGRRWCLFFDVVDGTVREELRSAGGGE